MKESLSLPMSASSGNFWPQYWKFWLLGLIVGLSPAAFLFGLAGIAAAYDFVVDFPG